MSQVQLYRMSSASYFWDPAVGWRISKVLELLLILAKVARGF